MLIPGALSSIRSERGFTLIETLVAMVTGVIVTGALFAILEVSMHQSTRISDVAQATQQGRITMTHMVDELHSSCIAADFAPVQAKSSATSLIFVNGYSEGAEVPSVGTASTGVRKDEIVWSKTAGTLTDSTSLGTGESKGEYTFGTKASVRIGEHISQSEGVVFKYYEYATAASTSTSAASSTLKEISLAGGELTAAQALKVASVLVSFTSAPTDNITTLGRSVDLSSQVTFAFSAPDSETPIAGGPCE